MCGIAGILKFDPNEGINEARLLAMRDSLLHRGPDDGGLMHDKRIGLAHRRLSIIDLSAAGHQPMANPQRTVWLSYNGEVYNFRELRTRLQGLGCHFETRSDTEVVLRAYEYYGESCVEHLSGMFAFAIWDAPKQRLFLARDRLGIKPLYYAVTGTQLLFGSEVKAILAEGSLQPEFNRNVLPEFLASRYVSGSDTFFAGVHKLLPGHTLSWTPDEGLRTRRYWYLSAAPKSEELSRAQYVDMVRSGLQDAVQSHMIADVPCGLFLSGGLDSSILAALMTKVASEPVHSFSVGFSEMSANEFEYARMAATASGTQHHEVILTPEKFFSALPHMVWHEDEPIAFTSSIPLNAVSSLAAKHVKVVLTGEGADELFLGYDYRYRVTAWNARFGKAYEKAFPGGLRRAIASGVHQLPPNLRRYAERTFLAMDTDPKNMFFENFSVFRQDLRHSLLQPELLRPESSPHAYGLQHYHAAGDEPLQCMSHADLQTFLVELLMKQDQMSMAASIESRVPFLDHRLVEQVYSIPAREKLRVWQTKALLRDAVKDLVPRAILERKKMGFPVPTSQWLRGRYWPMVEEFVLGGRALERGHFNPSVVTRIAQEHRQGHADHGERLWLLINLEMWQRIYVDGEAPDAIYPAKKPVLREFTSAAYQPALAG